MVTNIHITKVISFKKGNRIHYRDRDRDKI